MLSRGRVSINPEMRKRLEEMSFKEGSPLTLRCASILKRWALRKGLH